MRARLCVLHVLVGVSVCSGALSTGIMCVLFGHLRGLAGGPGYMRSTVSMLSRQALNIQARRADWPGSLAVSIVDGFALGMQDALHEFGQ